MPFCRIISCVLGMLTCLTAVGAAEVNVQKLVDEALAAGKSEVRLPTGVHKITAPEKGYHLAIKGAKNFTIVGDQTTLLFSSPRVGGIHLTDCANVTLKGLTLDWDPLPFTQGKITAIDLAANSFTLAIDAGFSDDPALFPRGSAALIYDAKTKLLKPNTWDYFGVTLTRPAERTLAVQCKSDLKNAGPVVGDLVALRALSGEMGIRFIDCAKITLDQVTILSAPGMAIQELDGDGGNSYSGVKLTRGPDVNGTPRLLSSCADGIHSSSVKRGPTIENCTLEYAGDDLIAIHGAYTLVIQSPDPATLIVAPRNEMHLRPGDRVRFYNGSTFNSRGESIIDSVSRIASPDAAILDAAAPLWKALKYDAKSVKYYQLKLKEPLPTSPGDLISSLDRLGSGFVIRNNKLAHTRARGMLLKANDGTIENNTIEFTGSAGLALGPEFASWLEGDYVQNITVKSNTLRGTNFHASVLRHDRAVLVAAICVYALTPDRKFPETTGNSNITIDSNTIESTGGIGLLLACAKNITVKNNLIQSTKMLGPILGGKTAGIDTTLDIFTTHCDAVTIQGNSFPKTATTLSTSPAAK